MSVSVSLFPPAIIHVRSDSGWGRSVAIYVSLPANYDAAMKAHELRHVTQWLLGLGVIYGLLYRFVPTARFWFEVDAYAAGVRAAIREGESADTVRSRIDRHAVALCDGYGLNVTFDKCRSSIMLRL